MNYGYARCSTNETKQDINRQVRELKAAGAGEIFLEYEHGDSKIHFQSIIHHHRAPCVPGFQGNQFDQTVLILHLPVNQNRTFFQIYIFPPESVTFIDA